MRVAGLCFHVFCFNIFPSLSVVQSFGIAFCASNSQFGEASPYQYVVKKQKSLAGVNIYFFSPKQREFPLSRFKKTIN